MASGDAVEQIKQRLTIVDVVSTYVELKPAGKNLKGRCPFHHEKTPSFNVSPDRGTYHCFGCGVGGDIFTFTEAINGLDFRGALKLLAERAGVELTPQDPQKKNERDRLFDTLEASTLFYTEWFQKKSEAKDYLSKRQVKPETIAKWRVGYAPGPSQHGWRELKQHLEAKGFTTDELVKAGLVKGAAIGKEPYDVFRDRVMFPICDASGRVVGFSGRILSKDSDAPKYVNSPETELFNKSEVLFGYDKAKQHIRSMDFTLIVEGQFDVIMSHQAGYQNTVAVSGTALTAQHVALIQRLSQRVVLALDDDKAGIAAVKRAAELMLARGMDVKVAKMEGGKDPADMVANDVSEFKCSIGSAQHVITYLLEAAATEAKDERNFKLKVREEVLPFVVAIPNRIDQEHFESIIAERLKTTKEAIHTEVERWRDKITRTTPPPVSSTPNHQTATPTEAENRLERQRQELLGYLIALTEVADHGLATKVHEIITQVTGRSTEANRALIDSTLLQQAIFIEEARLGTISPAQLRANVAHASEQFALRTYRELLRERREVLVELESQGEETKSILKEVTELQRRIGEVRYQPEDFLS